MEQLEAGAAASSGYYDVMPPQGSPAEPGLEAKVAEQLDRILNSRAFRQADRLKRFLAFVVSETMAGRGGGLKEFVIGTEVFGRPDSFDSRNDPLVRVQARRVRSQLARYYSEEGQGDELLIELPKGGYAPIFKAQSVTHSERKAPSALATRNSVLVVAFADHSPDSDLAYFCAGLEQEMVHRLAAIDSVRVMAPANRQEAALVVTGSVRRADNDLRITVNIVDAASGSYAWSGAFDRKLERVFALQEEVAVVVAEQVSRELAADARARNLRRSTGNLAAYNLYTQGRHYLDQRTEEGLRKAVRYFERAIAENEQYALAYSGLADAYGLLGHYGVLSPAEVWTKTASNATRAVLLDDSSAEAHASLAHVKATQDWDWPAAEHEYRRAIALDPRYPTTRHWFAASCLAPLGRLDEARDEILLAQTLDPISSIIAKDVARILYYRNDFDAALEQCDHTVELNPHFAQGYSILGMVQEQRGELDESAAAFLRAIQLSPRSPSLRAALARTLALAGKRDEAERIFGELEQLGASRYVSPFDLALVAFTIGDTNAAFLLLDKAFQDRCFELISLGVDPRWESMRSNGRFTGLVAQLGLQVRR